MVFSMSRPSSGCSLVYNATEDEPATLKSDGMYDKFIFSVGDSLEFKGYYNSLISTIKDAPTTNKSYTFYYSIMNIPCPGMPTITDSRDGQVYPTVQIGSQCWLQKNMNYNTGNSWCYDNSSSNCYIDGRLYDWQTAPGACPSGWHLPSDAEWTALTDFLGGESIAGGKMKKAGTIHWVSPNTGATNSSGFTALPGGGWYWYGNGGFSNLTRYGLFWSSTEYSSTDSWGRYLSFDGEYVYSYYNSKTYGFSARCVQDTTGSGTAPTVTTATITNITLTSATGGGEVTSQGSSLVMARGVCWSTSLNPTTSDSHTTNGSGYGSFTSNLTGLTANTPYYVRAYAANNAGTSYGNQVSFTTNGGVTGEPCPGMPTITDSRDGQVYPTVQIGSQCWLQKNMNYSTGNSWCYDNDSSNCNTYGRLYDWQTALGACPSGWHLPSDAEWTALTDFLGGESIAGGKMKEAGTAHWESPNTGATNSSGFTALPGSQRYDNGGFYGLGYCALFWSSTAYSPTYVWGWRLSFNYHYVYISYSSKTYGFSARCVQTTGSGTAPNVTTATISNITQTSATGGGEVTWQGSSPVTTRGVCWSTSSNPTTSDSHTTDGSGMGSFTSNITGLTANTYYVRAYATNNAGTSYGDQVSFTTTVGEPCPGMPTITDSRDGQVYPTVQIGSQCWLQKNMNYSTGNSWCYNNNTYCDTYGRLYDWQTALGACPSGWHLPSDSEWTALTDFLGGEFIAGGNMKEAGTDHWVSPNTGATNSSGFTALPGGYRYFNGYFDYLTNYGFYWSSTEYSSTYAWHRHLYYIVENVNRDYNLKTHGFSVRCVQTTGSGTAPTVTTATITNITQTSATGGGEVTSQGSSSVTIRGVCWSTSSNPTTSDSHTTDGSGTGSFTSNITGLTANTPYYVRAYATNNAGTSYGNQVSFTTTEASGGEPCPGTPTVLYEGKSYNTVQIGTQCWLRENLNVGTRINGGQDQTNNSIIEKYCYENHESNCNTYGGLYQWNELMQYVTTEGAIGICPSGWHIPTDAEWTTLTDFLGGESIAGGKMKEAGTAHWLSPNTGATNSSGFTALPGGRRNDNGGFYDIADDLSIWLSTEDSSTNAYVRSLSSTSEGVSGFSGFKTSGFSARCIKN
jgi:uncharacterized protein (TIGR02145 family)